jgi:hypothetical protein
VAGGGDHPDAQRGDRGAHGWLAFAEAETADHLEHSAAFQLGRAYGHCAIDIEGPQFHQPPRWAEAEMPVDPHRGAPFQDNTGPGQAAFHPLRVEAYGGDPDLGFLVGQCQIDVRAKPADLVDLAGQPPRGRARSPDGRVDDGQRFGRTYRYDRVAVGRHRRPFPPVGLRSAGE